MEFDQLFFPFKDVGASRLLCETAAQADVIDLQVIKLTLG